MASDPLNRKLTAILYTDVAGYSRHTGGDEEGTHSVYHWTLEGHNTCAGGTGNFVRIPGWEYWRYSDDGLIAASLGHFDAEDYARQVQEGI